MLLKVKLHVNVRHCILFYELLSFLGPLDTKCCTGYMFSVSTCILLIQWFVVNPQLGGVGGGGGSRGNTELFRGVRVAISQALKNHFWEGHAPVKWPLKMTCDTA